MEIEGRMDAHQVNAWAEENFGPTHSDLLHGFTEFLPMEHDPPPSSAEEDQKSIAGRRSASPPPSIVPADVPNRPSRAKKPGADDRRNQHALINVSERSTGGGAVAQDDDVIVVAFRKAWEFETEYSKLMATIRQAEKL